MALGRLPPAHLAACGCTQVNLIWIGTAAPVPKQDRRHIGGFTRHRPAAVTTLRDLCRGSVARTPASPCADQTVVGQAISGWWSTKGR